MTMPARTITVTTVTVALGALLCGGEAQAAGLRCGDAIASTGASTHEVRKICGEPDKIDHVGAFERWTYDFGSNRFVGIGLFRNGRLAWGMSGAYGHKPPQFR